MLKFKPQNRWWRKPEPEKPLQFRDYAVASIPGVIFAMMLGFGCQGTNVSMEAFLLAVLPMLFGGPMALFAFRHVKNTRHTASQISGIFFILWMLFVIGWLLFEPLTTKFGERMIYQYIIMLVLMMVAVVVMRRFQKSEPQS